MTKGAWNAGCKTETSFTKCDHVANVLAQLLDNNEDGVVDDPTMLAKLIELDNRLVIPGTEDEAGAPDG